MNKRIRKKIKKRFGFKTYKNYILYVENIIIPKIQDEIAEQISELISKYY